MEEFDLRKIFQVFWKRKTILFFIVITAVFLALLISVLSPKIYQAGGSMLVHEHMDKSSSKVRVDPQWYVNTQMELMKSQGVIRRVAEMWLSKKKLDWNDGKEKNSEKEKKIYKLKKREQLIGKNQISGSIKEIIFLILGKKKSSNNKLASLMGDLKEHVNVTNKFGSNVFYLDVEADDPELASALANVMMIAYQKENLRLKTMDLEDRIEKTNLLWKDAKYNQKQIKDRVAKFTIQNESLLKTDYIKIKENFQEKITKAETEKSQTLDSQLKRKKDKEIQLLKTKLTEIEGKIREQASANLVFADIQKSLKEKSTEFQDLDKKKRDFLNDLSDSVSDVQINDLALVPEKQIKPKIAVNLIIALVASTIFAMALAFLLEFVSRKIKNEGDLYKSSGSRVFCSFPAETLKSYINDIHHLPEQFRLLRTSIMASLEEGEKTLLITGSQKENDNTPFIATNLALAFSLLEERQIILVDVDFRKPRCHEILGMDITYGLVDYLIGALKDLNAKGTHLPNLKVITVGQIPPNPAELLESKKMREVTSMLESSSDIVIFCASSLATYPDASVLATLCHKTLLTATVDETSIEDMVKVKEILSHSKAKVIGSVLSNV